MIHGSVDDVNTKRVVGWVHSSSLEKEAFKVQATINNRVIGEAIADLFRPDLAAAKVGSGHCGFEISFDNAIDAAYLPFVEIRLAGGTLVLPRTTIGGFSDYFSGLYKKYPSVGRYSSILGGLWTDRSDANALLKARADVGRVAQGDSGVLSRFINEGLVIVEPSADQESAPARAALPKSAASEHGRGNSSPAPSRTLSDTAAEVSATIAKSFFQDDILRLLGIVLEDNPIAVKASMYKDSEKSFCQMSSWEELPSPAECLGLIVPLEDGVSVEVLRGSHWFPEFTADGTSRWTVEGRTLLSSAALAPNIYTDMFTIPPRGIAVLGSGVIHRVLASVSSPAIRILVLPSRQGSARFRQQAPADELTHRSGARIWLSELT
jgi:hypothetical protein